MKNEPSPQGLATAGVLVLKLNYRCNTFARDMGINFLKAFRRGGHNWGRKRENKIVRVLR